MKIVADTNTFLAVALEEPEKASIIRLTHGHGLVSPEVLPFEIGNALSALLKRRVLRPKELQTVWDAIERIPVELRRIEIRSALEIAAKFAIYAYDAYFLECALSFNLPLLTLDDRMKTLARELNLVLVEERS